MAIIMKTINEDGVEIQKQIEDTLYSQYIKMGWEEVKEEKKPISFSKISKDQPKDKEEKIDE